MSMQQFCLRWNNHLPNFISVFSNLLSSESLVDVTLAAEGRHLQAHKVVLSACSTYFQSLFTVNPCQHPIVILKDVKYNDLKIMVDFMYYGEVNVSQDQLPAILKTAEMLKIKGLADTDQHISSSVHMMKTESASSDKADLLTPGDSTWGSDSIRRSPSPMSPSLRRKRFRKSSTGSGSGSTERTSEEVPNEMSLGSSLVKPEPASYTTEAESGGRSDSSLRNSTQEPSTDSEPREGSQDSTEDDPLAMQMSHDSNVGVETQIADTVPGPSTSQQSMASQEYVPTYRETQSRSVLRSLYQRKSQFLTLKKGTKENFLQAIEDVRSGKYGFCTAAKIYGVSQMTLYRYYLSMGYPIKAKHKQSSNVWYIPPNLS